MIKRVEKYKRTPMLILYTQDQSRHNLNKKSHILRQNLRNQP